MNRDEQSHAALLQTMQEAIDDALATLVEPEILRVIRAGATAERQWLAEHNRAREALAARASAWARKYPYVPVIRMAMRFER